MADLSRRDFIKLAACGALSASGLVALGGLLRFLGYSSQAASKTEYDLGSPEDYPLGSKTVVADGSALIIHDKSGITAMSLICTHLGCTVDPAANGFACPCHGSLYASDGTVLRGPAKEPLRSLRIETNQAGHLILHTDA
jgi:cytochrome b6-f complex iron-sulfur subunit